MPSPPVEASDTKQQPRLHFPLMRVGYFGSYQTPTHIHCNIFAQTVIPLHKLTYRQENHVVYK